MGEGRAGAGLCAQLRDLVADRGTLLGGQVLPGDRMPQHRQCFVLERQPGDAVGGGLAFELCRDVPRDRDRAAQPLHPGVLVGPDIAQHDHFAVGAADIDGCDVVAVTFDDL